MVGGKSKSSLYYESIETRQKEIDDETNLKNPFEAQIAAGTKNCYPFCEVTQLRLAILERWSLIDILSKYIITIAEVLVAVYYSVICFCG